MQVKEIELHNNFLVKVKYHTNNHTRLYLLIDKSKDKCVEESYNRDSFLLKVRKYTKLNFMQESLIAQV